jgi:hypothetical protein
MVSRVQFRQSIAILGGDEFQQGEILGVLARKLRYFP